MILLINFATIARTIICAEFQLSNLCLQKLIIEYSLSEGEGWGEGQSSDFKISSYTPLIFLSISLFQNLKTLKPLLSRYFVLLSS